MVCIERTWSNVTDEYRTEDFFQTRKKELSGRVGKRRFQHSLGVSDTAVRLACAYGVDETDARVAGLLHDWDKGYDDPGILARAEEVGLPLTDELRQMPRVLHGLTAARALAQEFPTLPPWVLQAIERHTLGAEDMSDLDMVVYIADALEPGRKGDQVERLRKLIGEVPLQELFLETYAYWVLLIMERRHPMYSKTVDIWNAHMGPQEEFHAPQGADVMPWGRP